MKKAEPSQEAQDIAPGVWYYESRGEIHIIYHHDSGPLSIHIPWRKLISSLKRCRPETFE